MAVIGTIAAVLAGLAFLAGLGYPFVRLALPGDIRDEYGHLVVYPVGYLLLCMLAFLLSGSLHLAAATAVWVVSGTLLAVTALLLYRDRAWRRGAGLMRGKLREAAVLIAPMALVFFWPLFVNGADTYLGAVNPDYFAAIIDNYFLLKGHSIADFGKGADTFFPIDYVAGSISSSGRFASGLLAIQLEKLFRVETRTALTLSLALFLLCLPLAMYFFTRTVFGFERNAARLSAWLIGISAPVTMSYLYFYVGQNSGLAALPLTIGVGYLLLTRPDPRLLVLFALLVNALLVVYLGMLPYAIAPLGVLGLYLLATRRLPAPRLLVLAAGFFAITIALNAGMLGSLLAMARGWGNVIGQTLQGQYFLDFLTEAYIPLFLGVIVYPFGSSWAFSPIDAWLGTFVFALSLIVAFPIAYSVERWFRAGGERARLVTVGGALVVYTVVWWLYTFERQYGYAVFKMSSWLQFMLVPFVAYGLTVVFDPASRAVSGWKKAALSVCLGVYVATNALATIEYGIKGMGQDRSRGYIVNSFQMSGNREYFDLAKEVGGRLGARESVGLGFVDSIQNFWVAWYLRSSPVSLLAHENIPGDDENLPDIHTNQLVDYYGNVRDGRSVFFHGGADAYYLTWNEGHINRDIALARFTSPPAWQTPTFRLYKAADTPDMIFTGRGFYRTEYTSDPKPYWWPQTMRWTAEGGQVYLLHPSKPGKPYRVALDAIVGYELANDERTVQLWANGVQFDEFKVTSTARYISKPFAPESDVTRLVIKVRERVRPGKRVRPIWNRDIPLDYRRLNLVLANIHVAPEALLDSTAEKKSCGRRFEGQDLLRCAVAFNGVQIDSWIGQEAMLKLPVEGGISRARIRGSIPDSLGFRFPFDVKVAVDGVEHVRPVNAPGAFTIEVPIDPARAGGPIEIRLTPAHAARLASEFEVRHKVVTQSLHLDAIELL